MKLSAYLTAVACGSLASASPRHLASRGLSKRWDYDLCLDDCKLSGVPLPDKDNLQLPLEDFWSERCPPTYIGDLNSPSAASNVCLDFIGPNLYFKFASFPGYTTKSAKVSWKLKGNLLDSTMWSTKPPPYTGSLDCLADGTDFVCKLPFSTILGVSPATPLLDVLAGMCPNGDVQGLGFYFRFTGDVQSADGKPATFSQKPTCTKRETDRSCSAWDTSCEYIEVGYRCSKCDAVPPCPPPTSTTSTSTTATSTTSTSTVSTSTTSIYTPTATPKPSACPYGTAFGYLDKRSSYTLDTQSGQGCKRWGWYQTPSLESLKAGISGILYAGAGRNDISKATDVGTWTAKADYAGKVVVSLKTKAGYGLDEVHIDLACLPIDKCAPGSYTYGQDLPTASTEWTLTKPLSYPTCKHGKTALIIHAAVDKLTSGRCQPPKDDDDDDDHDHDKCKRGGGYNCDKDDHDDDDHHDYDKCKRTGGYNCHKNDRDDDHHGYDKCKRTGGYNCHKYDRDDDHHGHDNNKGGKWDDDDKHHGGKGGYGGHNGGNKGKGYGYY